MVWLSLFGKSRSVSRLLGFFRMDPSVPVKRLDSLWFFSSVLSSRTIPQRHDLGHENDQKPTKTEEPSEPTFPIAEKPGKEPRISDNSIPKRPERQEFAYKEASEEKQSVEKKKKSKQRRRRKRDNKKLDEPFDCGNGSRVFWETKGGHEGCGCPNEKFDMKKKMLLLLPVNDSMAMKEQLRTWAHAVACSVR